MFYYCSFINYKHVFQSVNKGKDFAKDFAIFCCSISKEATCVQYSDCSHSQINQQIRLILGLFAQSTVVYWQTQEKGEGG